MNNPLIALQIGGLARNALTEGCEGKVMGITSRGIFLNTGQRILFVTDADYRSPYNIQISIIKNQFETFIPGQEWWFSDDDLIFNQNDFRIDISEASLWHPAPPPTIETRSQEQLLRMNALLQHMLALDPGKGWLYLADTSDLVSGSEASIIHEMTNRFLVCVKNEELEGALKAGKSILGRGGGLTPSGDDWISGFLLYFARTSQQNLFICTLGRSLTDMAFESTTMISANRIEAACQGWSEELFLEIIDSFLVSDAEINGQKLERLINFGHSSGVDTCVGVGAALKVLSSDTL